MEQAYRDGMVGPTSTWSLNPQQKRYLDEMPGTPVDTIWDARATHSSSGPRKTRIGYPTQKADWRFSIDIIKASSSNEDDVVLGSVLRLCHRLRGRR